MTKIRVTETERHIVWLSVSKEYDLPLVPEDKDEYGYYDWDDLSNKYHEQVWDQTEAQEKPYPDPFGVLPGFVESEYEGAYDTELELIDD